MEIDYNALGLRVGLEIHQQLDTKYKLFCKCVTKLYEGSDEGIPRIERFLRVTRSEVGEVDPAALYEFMKGRKIIYLVPKGHACTVELDEEPPQELNREALAIALGVALALKSSIVDEIYVMRKIVIDGSNTTGFQRTAIIALGGEVSDEEGGVGIQTICLEEDAARKVRDVDNSTVYNLDRLGIPLIEISTAPDIRTPEQALRVASKIGMMLRLTGKVKRGLGTIRQDLNISIKDGAKVEIKGVQRLELLPKVIEYEVLRQVKLLEIRDELRRRGVSENDLLGEVYDVTEVFANTKSKLVIENVRRGHKVYATVLKGFKGILKVEVQPRRRFGTELADYARQWGGVSGLIHTDELPAYGISSEEVKALYNFINADEGKDAIVLVIGPEDRCLRALNAVVERAKEALKGVPRETRAANDDGTTRYMRPQPGAARMYPETDVPPVRVGEDLIKEALKYVPKNPDEVYEELVNEYLISPELSKQLLRSYYLTHFYDLVKEVDVGRVPPQFIASLLTIHLKSLKSEGVPVENITIEHLREVLKAVERGEISKEGVVDVLREVALDPTKPLSEVLQKYSLNIDLNQLEQIVAKVIESCKNDILRRREKAFNIVMGRVMKELRGRVDGKVVAEVVTKHLAKLE